MHEHIKMNKKLSIIPLLFLFTLLALLPAATRSQIPRARTSPHPLCNSELALANYACANLPLSPMPPPSSPMIEPPSSSPPDLNRPPRGDDQLNPQEVECCRWLKEVDNECVCDLLVPLPTFLSRPNHVYTLVVNQTCAVSYRCGGRLKP